MTNAAPSRLECSGAPRTGRKHPPARAQTGERGAADARAGHAARGHVLTCGDHATLLEISPQLAHPETFPP
jgi:hypothetical protein